MRLLLLCAAPLILQGCATFTTLNSSGPDGSVGGLYSGTRYNLALLNHSDVSDYTRAGCRAPPYSALLDLPMSLVADTAMLALMANGTPAHRSPPP